MAPTKRIEATAARIAGIDRFRPRRGPPGDDALHAGSPTYERPPPGYPAEPMAVRSVGDPLTPQRFQIWRRTGYVRCVDGGSRQQSGCGFASVPVGRGPARHRPSKVRITPAQWDG